MIAFQGYELEHDGLCWILRQMREKPSESLFVKSGGYPERQHLGIQVIDQCTSNLQV